MALSLPRHDSSKDEDYSLTYQFLMKRKLLYALGAIAVAVVVIPLFAAFEAHVVNVTARIENALAVSTDSIEFGTVFPQEHLDQPLGIQLSRSFLAEDRVDDVDYFIRQKPKCGVTTNDGTVLVGPTATGHVVVIQQEPGYRIDCGEPPRVLEQGETWGVLPSLCEYISKEGDDENDETTPSFHQPFRIVQGDNPETPDVVETSYVDWLDTEGRLAKSEEDVIDTWNIDLAVPCFGGFCAQDWENFVHGINPDADPDLYTQPIENEHKVFGCDLWIEVGGVSRFGILTVNKIIDGGQADPTQFSFSVDGGAPEAFEADGSNAMQIYGGPHVVTEPTPPPGYTPTFSGDCDAIGNVAVPPNGSATCTITNTFEGD